MERQREIEQEMMESKLPRDLRPTLVLGLGGTGQRILLHLKAELTRAFGAVPARYIRLLAFDTAEESLSVREDGSQIVLEPDREFFHIGHTPVPNIVHNLERQPAIAERLPAIHAIPAVALRNGARQLRPLGLLALLWRFEEVEQRISDAIWALADKENLGQREGQTQGINVFICNSLVGGSGAGMFLDIAFLVRALFDELGSMGDFCYITGVGILPQAFRGIPGPNLIPNGVASLKELSHCMLCGGFSAQYPNGRLIDTPHPPFDLYYLIDGVDAHGYTWRGLGELSTMVAAGIFLQIGSQVGLKGENDFDNLSDVLSQQTPEGQGTFCGSFGMATLTFPARQLAAWCRARLAGQIVEQGLLREVDKPAVTENTARFWQTYLPTLDTLLTAVAQDEDGLPLVVDPGAAAWLQQPGRMLTVAEILRYISDYQNTRVQGIYYKWVEGHANHQIEQLIQAWEAELSTLLQNPEVGFRGGSGYVKALQVHLTSYEQALEQQCTLAEQELRRYTDALPIQEKALRQAETALFVWRGRALLTARDRYLETATQMLTWQLQSQVCQVAQRVLTSFRQALQQAQQQFEQLVATLNVLRRRLAAEERRLLTAVQNADGAVADISLIDPGYVQQLYQRYAPPVVEVSAELLRALAPQRWWAADQAELLRRLQRTAAQPFESLKEMTVEDVLRERKSEVSADAYRARVFRLAAPSWNLDRTRLQDGGAQLQTIRVLGVPDETTSVYRDHLRMLVSTHDPTTVTAFVATFGASFTALQQYPDYVRAYQQARKHRIVHVLPQFQTEGEQAKLAFALGIIYDFIFSRGFYFYLRPEDELDPPVKLGNGLANAVHAFAQHDALVAELMGRVEQRIAETGTKQALDVLTTYYQPTGIDAAPPTDELVITMRKLVRAYAQELRSTQQAFGEG
jgi:hypothetical protein